MSSFDRLHPSLQHHIVNSLGWQSLTPLQEKAIGPILEGSHALLLAPTAGGKTESAIFPVLSRLLDENWKGLSIIYLCPIKALLNNLHSRLEHYFELVGRRVALWHGDVGDTARRRVLEDPPDLLLTTPESLELLLISRRVDHNMLLGNVKVVIVDEVHAFAGDDRGWHLLSVVNRASKIAGRLFQRIALSATVGNSEELLKWVVGPAEGDRQVIQVEASEVEPEVEIDYVGTIQNAARVISKIHVGEKRLIFCDSRARVEELSRVLREEGVETFVSHSSLSLDQRRQAEKAFREARNCVIVATSTLELGIDVGDLDRVIQIDAPPDVASFLQRMGRTGRRPGTRRNCLILTTSEDAAMLAAGVVELWSSGYIDPVVPPPLPYHLYAQQVMALAIQEGGIPIDRISYWLNDVPAFAEMEPADRKSIVDHMIENAILWSENGILWIGPEGEREYGRRYFMDLLSIFDSPPLFKVMHGRSEIGYVHESTFQVQKESQTVLLLGGRSWLLTHLDWSRREAFVVPSKQEGRSRWLGSGQPLSFDLCQAVKRVLVSSDDSPRWTDRMKKMMADVREEFSWLEESNTAVVAIGPGRRQWWTFAGLLANAEITNAIRREQLASARPDNLGVSFDNGISRSDLATALLDPRSGVAELPDQADELKFSSCVPLSLLAKLHDQRLTDPRALRALKQQPVVEISGFMKL